MGFGSAIVAVVALNAFTHPLVFFFFMALKQSLLQDILYAEIFAFAFEIWACFYFLRLPLKQAVVGATAANLVSWQFGSILTYFLFLAYT